MLHKNSDFVIPNGSGYETVKRKIKNYISFLVSYLISLPFYLLVRKGRASFLESCINPNSISSLPLWTGLQEHKATSETLAALTTRGESHLFVNRPSWFNALAGSQIMNFIILPEEIVIRGVSEPFPPIPRGPTAEGRVVACEWSPGTLCQAEFLRTHLHHFQWSFPFLCCSCKINVGKSLFRKKNVKLLWTLVWSNPKKCLRQNLFFST